MGSLHRDAVMLNVNSDPVVTSKPPGFGEPTFDERTSPLGRRFRRALRPVTWRGKGMLRRRATILVEIRWRLGDEIMALPVYGALRAQYPKSRIVVWCNYPELLANRDDIDGVNEPVRWADKYVLLRGAPRDAYRAEVYARRAGLTRRLDRPAINAEGLETPLRNALPRGGGRLIALAPGASWRTKCWAPKHWQALARGLSARGYRVFELCAKDESVGIEPSLAGRTTVCDAAALLREADVAVAHDSGLMHLALAVGTPVVGLFGPTAPEMVVRDERLLTPITNGRACGACWNIGQRMVTPGVCPRGLRNCMDTIHVGEVIAAVEGTGDGGWAQCVSFF